MTKIAVFFISLWGLSMAWTQGAIVFSTEVPGGHHYWKVKAEAFTFYEDITLQLNSHALYSGFEKGPISISPNGEWYVFRSTRFNADAFNGVQEAITICNHDFSIIETITTQGNAVINGEGIAQVSNDGDTIFFCNGGGTHNRDIFWTSRLPGDPAHWHDPLELTTTSPYLYNTNPQVSYDRNLVVFDGSSDPYIGQYIVTADLSGNINTLVSATTIPGCGLVHSGTIDANGFLYFEAETDAERIWKKMGAAAPAVIDNSLTNDNSPYLLPDGRIGSLHLPSGVHQLKVMYNDASGVIYPSYSDKDIADIGVGAGEYIASITGLDNLFAGAVNVYPNPAVNYIKVEALDAELKSYQIMNTYGEVVQSSYTTNGTIAIDELPKGMYILILFSNNYAPIYKRVVKN